ncbi:MAG: hypothetical protein AB4426_29175 [Xenococcaceae cyanobacterium]
MSQTESPVHYKLGYNTTRAAIALMLGLQYRSVKGQIPGFGYEAIRASAIMCKSTKAKPNSIG